MLKYWTVVFMERMLLSYAMIDSGTFVRPIQFYSFRSNLVNSVYFVPWLICSSLHPDLR